MQAIIVCRFIVDLRYTDTPEDSVEAIPSSELSIQFLRRTPSHVVVGDMGHYLGHDPDPGEDGGAI